MKANPLISGGFPRLGFVSGIAIAIVCHLAAAAPLRADEAAGDGGNEAAVYVDEAPLPEGWPAPGPYGEVAIKELPAYRAAFTTREGRTGAFWRLFAHINRNDIPMTAPVEMAMEEDEEGMRMASMGFLYQGPDVGSTGADGPAVEVRDVPAARVLSYAWQGRDSRENIAIARDAIEAALAEKGMKAGHFRLLGYNGPRTPRDQATWELQAVPVGSTD